MARDNRKHSRPAGRTRRGPGAWPVIVGAGLFAALVGGLYLAAGRTPGHAGRPVAAVEPSPAASVPVIPRSSEPPAPPQAEAVAVSEAADAAPAAPPQTLHERVQARLEAGEFGPALQIALAASDVQTQTELLQLIAAAQLRAGEPEAALATIRRMPIPEARVRARGEQAAQQALAGGMMADFQPLMDLIMETTSGPWEEIDGEGGTMSSFDTGVRVDPNNGMLFHLTQAELGDRLKTLGVRARQADLNDDMARSSSLRLVSLTRLEQEVARRLAEGQPPLETMKHLAGLSQVQYIFAYPEQGEIVIGGPAEGWQYNEMGLPVGVESGRPTLQLDDFVTVLRTFSRGGFGMFNCLIVPRQEGLRAVKEFSEATANRSLSSPGSIRHWVSQLEAKLGLQDVEINGLPTDSRVARVILEADYRMKLIGVGKLEAASDIPSYFDLLTPEDRKDSGNLDALRWWLTMKYDAILHSSDRAVFEVRGSSVLCLSENELIDDDGSRIHTGKADTTNRLFAESFTRHYAELARRDLVFADLQNIFDLSLVAALITHERLDQRTDWQPGVFASGGAYRPAVYEPAQTVMTVANHRTYGGRDIIVQVAGGVRGDLMTVVRNGQTVQEVPRLGRLSDRGRAPELPEGRWWWDAP